jgi:hypothetical protein
LFVQNDGHLLAEDAHGATQWFEWRVGESCGLGNVHKVVIRDVVDDVGDADLADA